MTQPHASRSALPQGTPQAADLLVALDRYATSPAYEPGVLSRIASRLGFKWILIRNDLDWERIGVPRPASFAALRADPSFEQLKSFGPRGVGTNRTDTTPSEAESALRQVELYEIVDAPGMNQGSRRFS